MSRSCVGIAALALLVLLAPVCSCGQLGVRGRALVFEPQELPGARVGEAYDIEIVVTENRTPVGDFYVTGALPPGLEFVWVEGESSARIVGIPEEAGTFKVVANVWCLGTNVNGQTGEQEYELVVE